MCRVPGEIISTNNLRESANNYRLNPFDHDVCEVSGEIRHDGKRIRIVVNSRDRWIQVGCTRITFTAIDLLRTLCQTDYEKIIQE